MAEPESSEQFHKRIDDRVKEIIRLFDDWNNAGEVIFAMMLTTSGMIYASARDRADAEKAVRTFSRDLRSFTAEFYDRESMDAAHG